MRFKWPKLSFNLERWKWNEDMQIYISNRGRLADESKKEINLSISDTGYFIFQLKNGKIRSVHRMVLETWRPQKDYAGLTVDHINSNKRDNTLANLEWVSRQENHDRANAKIALAREIARTEVKEKKIQEDRNAFLIDLKNKRVDNMHNYLRKGLIVLRSTDNKVVARSSTDFYCYRGRGKNWKISGALTAAVHNRKYQNHHWKIELSKI